MQRGLVQSGQCLGLATAAPCHAALDLTHHRVCRRSAARIRSKCLAATPSLNQVASTTAAAATAPGAAAAATPALAPLDNSQSSSTDQQRLVILQLQHHHRLSTALQEPCVKPGSAVTEVPAAASPTGQRDVHEAPWHIHQQQQQQQDFGLQQSQALHELEVSSSACCCSSASASDNNTPTNGRTAAAGTNHAPCPDYDGGGVPVARRVTQSSGPTSSEQPAADLQQEQEQQGLAAAQQTLQQQEHPQQQQQLPPFEPSSKPGCISKPLQRHVRLLLSQGNCQAADDLLWSTVMRINSLDALQAAAGRLDAVGLMRPAVIVALIVQLGQLVTRAAKQQHGDRLLVARAARRAAADAANQRRMAARKQRRMMAMLAEQQQLEQQQHQAILQQQHQGCWPAAGGCNAVVQQQQQQHQQLQQHHQQQLQHQQHRDHQHWCGEQQQQQQQQSSAYGCGPPLQQQQLRPQQQQQWPQYPSYQTQQHTADQQTLHAGGESAEQQQQQQQQQQEPSTWQPRHTTAPAANQQQLQHDLQQQPPPHLYQQQQQQQQPPPQPDQPAGSEVSAQAATLSSSSSSNGGKVLRLHKQQQKQKLRRKLRQQRRLLLHQRTAYEATVAAKLLPRQTLLKQLLQHLAGINIAKLSPLQLDLLPVWLNKLAVQDAELWQRLQAAATRRLKASTLQQQHQQEEGHPDQVEGQQEQPQQRQSAGDKQTWPVARSQVRVIWSVAKQVAASSSNRGIRGRSSSPVLPPGSRAGVAAAAGAAGAAGGTSRGRSGSPRPSQGQQQQPQQQQWQQRPRQAPQRLPDRQSSGSTAFGVVSSDSSRPGSQLQQQSLSPEFVAAWLESSTSHLHTFSPSQLAASIYSLALLKQPPPPAWRAAFFAATQPQLHKASAQDLANTLWGLATLGLNPDAAWWGAFQVATSAQLGQFEAVGIANLIWAAGKLQLTVQEQLGELLLWQAQRKFAGMDLQLLSSLLRGVVWLRLKPRRLWLHQLCKRVSVLYGCLTPSLTSSIMLSLGTLQHCKKSWMARTLAAVQPQLRSFGPQDVAQVLVAFACMHYTPHPEWLFEFTLEARRVLPRANKQQLLMVADSLAQLANSSEVDVAPELLAAVLARARVLLGCPSGVLPAEQSPSGPAAASAGGRTVVPAAAAAAAAAAAVAAGGGDAPAAAAAAAARIGAFSPADCANLVQPLVHLHVAPGSQLLGALYSTFVSALPHASGSQTATMLWAMGAFWRSNTECLWLRQHPDVAAALVAAAQPALSSYEPLQLKRVVVALAATGYNPGSEWLAVHEAAVLGQLPRLWGKTLEQVLRAYRELGYSSPRQSVLREALAVKLQQEAQQQAHQQQLSQGQ